MSVIAIIPARGGSKSIPRKNIKFFNDVPLLAYSIQAVIESSLVDRVICSTDDQEIAEIARRYGAEVPFIRPEELAQDKTLDYPVFVHALDWLESMEVAVECLVHLRPTCPFRPVGIVDRAVSLLLDNPEYDSVRSVVPSHQNPFKMYTDATGRLKPLIEIDGQESYNMPRQELPETYWHSGLIDVMRSKTLRSGSISGSRIGKLETEPIYSLDLDEPWQWSVAELIMDQSSHPYIKPQKR